MKRFSGREEMWIRLYRQEAASKQKNRCFWCGEPIVGCATADHFVPLAAGGRNTRDNIVAACWDCNQLKGCMSADEFRALLRDPSLLSDDAAEHLRMKALRAHIRFRIWSRTWKTCERIMRAAGLRRLIQ